MNINQQYAWRSAEDCRENNPLLPRNLRGLDDLYNGATKDQLELDWITWQRDYALNKTWGDSRTSILEAMQCKL